MPLSQRLHGLEVGESILMGRALFPDQAALREKEEWVGTVIHYPHLVRSLVVANSPQSANRHYLCNWE